MTHVDDLTSDNIARWWLDVRSLVCWWLWRPVTHYVSVTLTWHTVCHSLCAYDFDIQTLFASWCHCVLMTDVQSCTVCPWLWLNIQSLSHCVLMTLIFKYSLRVDVTACPVDFEVQSCTVCAWLRLDIQSVSHSLCTYDFDIQTLTASWCHCVLVTLTSSHTLCVCVCNFDLTFNH